MNEFSVKPLLSLSINNTPKQLILKELIAHSEI